MVNQASKLKLASDSVCKKQEKTKQVVKVGQMWIFSVRRSKFNFH